MCKLVAGLSFHTVNFFQDGSLPSRPFHPKWRNTNAEELKLPGFLNKPVNICLSEGWTKGGVFDMSRYVHLTNLASQVLCWMIATGNLFLMFDPTHLAQFHAAGWPSVRGALMAEVG